MDSIEQRHGATTSMSIANNNNTDPEELKRVGSAYKGNCFKHHTIISKEMHGLSALITTQS
jgi:hypothetical protein